MTYKVDLDIAPIDFSKTWVASVESLAPTERVLLRNRVGNLEQCRDAIGEAIAKHALNPWHEHSIVP